MREIICSDDVAQVSSLLVIPADGDEIAAFFKHSQVFHLLRPTNEASLGYNCFGVGSLAELICSGHPDNNHVSITQVVRRLDQMVERNVARE